MLRRLLANPATNFDPNHSYLVNHVNGEHSGWNVMLREPVESSVIASMGYAPAERVLELEFRGSGDIYDYFDVPPEVYAEFREAKSKGTYLNQVFKNLGYPYTRVR